MAQLKPIVIADLRGGRNGTDPPLSLPLNQCPEALNVDWKDATLAHKRGGSTALSQTGGTAFSTRVGFLARHVPAGAETAAELWGIDMAATPIVKRLTGGTSWADITMDDAATTADVPQTVGVSFNGKLFLAFNSAQDRLHAYDPANARVRRVGVANGGGTPTVADTGNGSYAAILRYYRIRFVQVSGGVVLRRSEPTTSVAFTPSAQGTAAQITRSAAPGEGETFWELEASTDNVTFYVIVDYLSSVAVATTTMDDSVATTTYSLYRLSDPAGRYGFFPSVKVLMTDGNRLLGGGAWETSGATSGGKGSRVWFTPVLGSLDTGDDERVPNEVNQKNWVDLNENDGGAVTGCGGPLNGVAWFFKYRQVWKLRPTGDPFTPYLPRRVRDDVGCVSYHTLAMGEDQLGGTALYFLSHRGPYRITNNGEIQYLGRDNEDLWRTLNLAAARTIGHSVYYPDLHQWWLWVATGSADDASVKMMFDVQLGFPDEHGQVRGGWAKHTGDSCTSSACSTLFSNTVGASMSSDLKPYTAASSTRILKCDTSDADDAGAAFQAYATTRPLLMTGDLRHKVGMGEPTLIGKALAGSDVSVTINRDFGLETRTSSVSLAPAASETRVVKKLEGLEMGEADVMQVTTGDSSANTEVWTVDAVIAPVIHQEVR